MSQLHGKLGSSITYQQYFDLLIEVAIQYDLEHQSSHQRHCTRRSVYQHDMELLHEDSYTDYQPSSISDDNINNSYTAQMHNFDTPVYELNQLRQSQRPLLPKGTWHSLSQDDKSRWDQLTDNGKQTIIDGNRNQPQSFQNRNPHQYAPSTVRPSFRGNQPSNLQRATRKVKMHEFDSQDFAEFYKIYSTYQVT